MTRNSPLFWQPKIKLINLFLASSFGHFILVVLNYLIWLFFLYLSYLLVRQNPNTFWLLLFATIISEILERYIKSKKTWGRPMFEYLSTAPKGLVNRWYQVGSFPSGHTIKATFFFLLIIQFAVFSPLLFCLITIPLLLFRVLSGFHYPIDLLGGVIIGVLVWLSVFWINMPDALNLLVQSLFNLVFFIN